MTFDLTSITSVDGHAPLELVGDVMIAHIIYVHPPDN